MTDHTDRLRRLGDAPRGGGRRRPHAQAPPRARRAVLAGAVLAIALPGAAIATSELIGTDEVADSLPAGTLALAGTEPRCEVVRENVEYRRTLERAPATDVSASPKADAPQCEKVRPSGKVALGCKPKAVSAPAEPDWLGVVEPTVDKTKHVNGGCRSLASDGRTWQCYIGQEAVRQRIIGPGFLGEYAPSPGVS